MTDSTAPMSVVVESSLVPVPVVLVTVTVGKSVYAIPPSCTNIFCIEPDSVGYLISKGLKQKIEANARALNFLPKQAQLPV